MESRAETKKPRTFIPLKSVCCAPVSMPDPEEVASRAKLLAALGDPTRLTIVEMLAGQEEPLCVCDIQEGFSLGQPTISHHLRILREARLVTTEKRGLWVYYSLNRETLQGLGSHVADLLSTSVSAPATA